MGKFTRGLFAWLADFFSVVLIVLCNKTLMSPPFGFHFPVTLTAAHFTFTALVSRVVQHATANKQHESDLQETQPLPLIVTIAFVLVSSAAIITVNASLLLNSVAFYQIMKMLTLPLVAAFEAISKTKHYNWRHLCAFAVIMIGVGLTVEGDMESSVGGTVSACASVLFAAVSQIMCGRLQIKYQISPSKLLTTISPFKAMLLLLIGPPLDRFCFAKTWIINFAWTDQAIYLFSMSCVLAVAVNLAQYTAINLLGAGMYAALGQVKTSALIVLGSLIFHGRATSEQLLGTCLAILAVWSLAWLDHGQQTVIHVKDSIDVPNTFTESKGSTTPGSANFYSVKT